jgi:TolB-like protein
MGALQVRFGIGESSDGAYLIARYRPTVAHESPGSHLTSPLRLLTFGGLSVHGHGGPLAGSAAQPRRLAVLALIARGGARGVTRGKVLGLLWPDAREEQGRRVITQALYALRRDLGSDAAIHGTQDLRLNAGEVWCDSVQFDDALSRGDRSRAAELYVGPFLDGFRLPSAPEFERWADDERLAIQHRLHEALEQLAKDAEQQGAFDHAARWWRRRASDDPLNTRVAIGLMQALAAAGDPAGALRHAAIFEALVQEELDLPLEREVRELAESLRRQVASTRTKSAVPRSGLSLAVLPPVDHSDAPAANSGRWSEALADEMINALAAVPSLRVVSRSASWPLGASPDLSELRTTLGAALALEGSVRRNETRVRVMLRLVDTTDGHTVWAERFEHPEGDPFDLHHDIATRVATRVRETLV